MALQIGGGSGGGGGASNGGLTGRYQVPENGVTLTGPQHWAGSGTSDTIPVEPQAPAAPSHPSSWGGFGDFFSQLYGAGKGLVQSVGKVAALPLEVGNLAGSEISGHQANAQKDIQDLKSSGKEAVGFLQPVPRTLAQVGMSVAQNPFNLNIESHLLGADHTWAPSNTLTKAIFGDTPVQSLANVWNTTPGSIGNKLGAETVNIAGDALAAGGIRGTLKAPASVINSTLDSALGKYHGLRTQAAISQLPPDTLALPAGTGLGQEGAAAAAAKAAAATKPGGSAAPLQLPAEAITSPVKTTTGANAGTFGDAEAMASKGATVSPETAAKIAALDDTVHQYGINGPHPNEVSQLGVLNAIRLNAAAAVKGLAEDRARLEASDGQNPAELIPTAHQDLVTGTDPASLHYQHALEIAKQADAAYQEQAAKLGGKPVSDINMAPKSPAEAAAAQAALDAAKTQGAQEVSGLNGAQIPGAVSDVHAGPTAAALVKHLKDVIDGNTHGSALHALNALIQHPDVSPVQKAEYIAQRDALLPSGQRGATGGRSLGGAQEVPLDAGGSDAQAAAKGQAQGRVAYDYNPNEAVPHTIVPASQLHAGARNVFDETLNATKVGDTKAAPLSRDATASVYHGLAAETARLAAKLKPENIKLIDQIESRNEMTSAQAAERVQKLANTIKDAKQRDIFLQVVDSMKKGKDTRYLSDTTGLGRDMGYIQNHLTHVYEHKGAPSEFAPTNGKPGYMNQRIIATKAEAEALSKLTGPDGAPLYPHLKLADVNAVEAHIMSMKSAAFEHGDEAFRQAIDQAHPGAVVGKMINGQYEHITQPNGVDVSGEYNKRLTPKSNDTPLGIRTADGHVDPVKDGNVAKALKENPGSRLVNAATGEDLHSNKIACIIRGIAEHPLENGYDKVNQALKTSVLGGGTFHLGTTAGTVMGQQLVRGALHPTEIPHMIVDNLRTAAGTFNRAAHEKNMAGFEERGTKDFAQRTGTTLGSQSIDTGGAHVPIISHIHDAVFQRHIPEAKLMIMEQTMNHKFPGMDFKNPTPEQIAYGRDVSSQVNNLGGINRAIEGLSPRAARNLGSVVLAPDYTEGKLRTVYNAFTDAGPKGNIARQAVVGKTVLFALPGLVALTLAGKINWNDPQDVAKNITDQILDPQVPLGSNGAATKANPGGVPQSLHLPTTFVSELGKIIKPAIESLQPGGAGIDALSGAKSWLTNRSAAAIGIGARLAQNKDFYGDPIYGNDKEGNPIGAGKSALNITSQVAPIPVTQGIKQVSGQQGLLDTALNTAGGRVSNDTNSVEAIKSGDLTHMYNAFTPALPTKSAIDKKVQTLVTEGNIAQAHRVAQEWNARLQAVPRNYPDDLGPNAQKAWDAKWKSLEIKTNSRADYARIKSGKTSAALNNINQ